MRQSPEESGRWKGEFGRLKAEGGRWREEGERIRRSEKGFAKRRNRDLFTRIFSV